MYVSEMMKLILALTRD